MRVSILWLRVIVLLVLVAAAGVPGRATTIHVRGASTYGGNVGFGTCVADIIDFLNTSVASNCEGFTQGVFTIGSNTYSGDQFAFLEPGGTGYGILDIITMAGNSTLSLNLLNTALPTGAFMCGSFGNASSVAQDSGPKNMPGLACTTGSSNSTTGFTDSQVVTNVSATHSLNGVKFTNGNSGAIAIFATDGNISGSRFTATTPEPGSLALLGFGLVALSGKLRRKLA
jgi:PEP-CTERM motif